MQEGIEIYGVTSPTMINVLRGAGTIIAGDMDFPYDRMVQIRVAVSEMYDILCQPPSQENGGEGGTEVWARFTPRADGTEVSLSGFSRTPVEMTDGPSGIDGLEVLRSIVDELSVTAEEDGKTTLWIAKRKSPNR